jgi:phosphatidylglycerol:prolipoprotein diacylglycerol transferase
LVEAANGVRRFPIQLVEAGLNLLLFFLLWYLFKKEKLQQRLLYLYFLIYPIIRFTLEFFRGDSYRGFLFGLSTSQLISILLFLYAVIMLVVTRKKEAKS